MAAWSPGRPPAPGVGRDAGSGRGHDETRCDRADEELSEAREHRIRRTVSLSGTVDTLRTSVVASEVEGLVVELAAREGDLVREGQALARLRQQDLERSVVRAPFAGVVVEEHTQVGEWIAVGGPVVALQDADELEGKPVAYEPP